MTKIAFGCDSLPDLQARLERRGREEGGDGKVRLTTRYLPKRHAEMIDGSLYWIIAHRLMARSRIAAFEEAPGGKTHIVLDARAIPVASVPRRAHQGWRYLEEKDAPADLREGEEALGEMPRAMLSELTKLSLL